MISIGGAREDRDRLAQNSPKPLSSSPLLGLAVEPGPGIQATLARSPIQHLVLQGLFFDGFVKSRFYSLREHFVGS
jgi:hypothetical protein